MDILGRVVLKPRTLRTRKSQTVIAFRQRLGFVERAPSAAENSATVW
jgi:hypothetical protein